MDQRLVGVLVCFERVAACWYGCKEVCLEAAVWKLYQGQGTHTLACETQELLSLSVALSQ